MPLKLHGDGTPVTGLGKQWGRLVDIYSLGALLVQAPVNLRLLAMSLHRYIFTCQTLEDLHCVWTFRVPGAPFRHSSRTPFPRPSLELERLQSLDLLLCGRGV